MHDVFHWNRVMDRPSGRSTDMEAGISATIAGGPPLAVPSEAETFADLYERCFTRVYGYVASLLRDRSAAEDVTAQAFERAYRKRSSYRAGPRQPRGMAVRNRPQRRPRRAAPAQAPRAARRGARGPHPARPRRAGRARAEARGRPGRALHPRSPRPRPRGAQVRRRSLQRRDRARARHHRVQRGHPSAPNRHKAEEGLR